MTRCFFDRFAYAKVCLLGAQRRHVDNKTLCQIALSQGFKGAVNFIHFNHLAVGINTVLRAEIQHFLRFLYATN